MTFTPLNPRTYPGAGKRPDPALPGCFKHDSRYRERDVGADDMFNLLLAWRKVVDMVPRFLGAISQSRTAVADGRNC